ncbi:MAG: phosphotransferase [Anaerolineales bacterium]|nr:phosphotransferase [Anaerolineales bacterium]
MKPYDELTPPGQRRRQRRLVLEALVAYDLQVARLRFLAQHTSTYFRLDAADGRRYAVRIYSRDSTPAENRAEMFWLEAINRDTDLRVLRPVPRRDGGLITHLAAPYLPGEQRLAVYHWIPGHHLAKEWTPQNYARLGACMAQLHNHSAALALPADVNPKRWDRVFYFPDEWVVYRDAAYAHLFSAADVALLDTAVAHLDPFLANLYAGQGKPMLIHGDLHVWNVHVHDGELHLFDFEDLILGYPLHDVAITLFYGRSRPDYPALRAAFQAGYSQHRPWPAASEPQLQTLLLARTVNFINYVAWSDPDPADYIADRLAEVAAFFATPLPAHP